MPENSPRLGTQNRPHPLLTPTRAFRVIIFECWPTKHRRSQTPYPLAFAFGYYGIIYANKTQGWRTPSRLARSEPGEKMDSIFLINKLIETGIGKRPVLKRVLQKCMDGNEANLIRYVRNNFSQVISPASVPARSPWPTSETRQFL